MQDNNMQQSPTNILQAIENINSVNSWLTQAETDALIERLKQKCDLEFFEANEQIWVIPINNAKPLKMVFKNG